MQATTVILGAACSAARQKLSKALRATSSSSAARHTGQLAAGVRHEPLEIGSHNGCVAARSPALSSPIQ
jgi:hypothetical protein